MRVLLLAGDGFEDCELFYPLYRFREEGHQTVVAGPSDQSLTGKHGYTIRPDAAFSGVRADSFDVLIVPGGRGPEVVRLDADAVALTRQMVVADKIVGAVCHGIQVLISAGVLEDRNATCWKGVRDDLQAAGGNYTDEEVVVDGQLVTSRQPEDLPAFCRELFKLVHASTRKEHAVNA